MKEYIWKIHHKPTGLFYCSRKGRTEHSFTNLSEKGSFYITERAVDKVLKEDCRRTCINKAQTEKANLPIVYGFPFNGSSDKDFEILKYSINLIKE